MLSRQNLSIAALAAATLLFESTLTRLLAVAQFYHFSFLVVSLALLGFGASGTLLSVFPRLRAVPIERLLTSSGIGFSIGVGIAYAGVNWLPFDSYSIAWERRQLFYFLLYYLALTIPFLISGLGIGGALALTKGKSHFTYAANLLGSALGALLAPLMLSMAGVPGAVLMSSLIGVVSTIIILRNSESQRFVRSRVALISFLGIGLLSFGGLVAANWGMISPLGMEISPYKGLSYAHQYPGSRRIFGQWNAISRIDVIENAGTRRLPGLSYQYLENPPPQLGLSIDADALQPITLTTPESFYAAPWLPEALAFSLKPGAEALIIEPGGGLGVLQALAGDADDIVAIIEDQSIQQTVARTAQEFDIYSRAEVRVISEPGRVYLYRDNESFDVVFFPLTDDFRPVTSGAYSLGEDYMLTVEAFEDAIERLSPGGVLVISRWLQSTPSESLRLIATLVESLDSRMNASPDELLIAYRGIQSISIIVKPDGWKSDELSVARDFIESRRFDWVWAPGIQKEQVNRFNKLPEPVYYQGVRDLLSSERSDFYASYPYDIQPTTDNQPFFFHFFTWAQTPEVLNTIGMTWQPFGGSGYLVLLALLVLVVLLSGVLILSPIILQNRFSSQKSNFSGGVFAYFALIGIAFLFVEIPLIQQWILLLGQPIYAFTTVVGILLLSSGLGSTTV
ncbi:MAG: class I SAM-dependent methyltransferase, partial [Chloroflexi bacterium]|nr:class I SAM-dependent methyltransferase [Chloroflexota bacterium]